MKLHYVYYAIRKDGTHKVGATTNPKNRFKIYHSATIIQSFDCPWKCGDKEIELQYAYFKERDSNIHYALVLNLWKKSPVSIKGSNKNKEWIDKGVNVRINNNSYIMTEERRDKIKKGCEGINNKLTEEDVRFIKKHYFRTKNQNTPIPKGKMNTKQLVEKFNVTKQTILRIAQKQSWKHI